MPNSITINSISNGTANITFHGGGDVLTYAFQQTAAETSVTVEGPNLPATSIEGKSGTGGALTYLDGVIRINLPGDGSDQTYNFSLKEYGRGLSRIISGVKDIEVGGQSYQSTCILSSEDGGDNDYNDLTVIISWFDKAK